GCPRVFFLRTEDGRRHFVVTGVQTCALPISDTRVFVKRHVFRHVADLSSRLDRLAKNVESGHRGRSRRRWQVAGKHSERGRLARDRKSTRLNSSHVKISYAVFCLKKKKIERH